MSVPLDPTHDAGARSLGEAAAVADSPITVVGIGASAGGLEALSHLFRHVPAHTGLAYVVVQHLSPTHVSNLAELLGREATIPVHQVTNGMRVVADRAYVIAPDTEMTLTDGHLKLVPRDTHARPPLPIDTFFRSLSEVQGGRTIGVILSGSGSDGALGIRAMRGAGGITFAQEPASAASDGMPRAAIATDCIDVVAPPNEIGEQLARLGQHPYLRLTVDESAGDTAGTALDVATTRASKPIEEISTEGIAGITALLRQRFRVDFDLYKRGTVERRIRRRMALRRLESLREYADVLRLDMQELDALYGDLLIGVTRFFRDPEVFGEMSLMVLPNLLAHRGTTRASAHASEMPIRAWVAGCSTGEEAYSIAITLLELIDKTTPGAVVQVFATDLSESAIAVARAGVYPEGIEADVTPERLKRFFVKEPRGYRVSKAVRDCCVFARQNITADPPFSQLDLITCRNLLIYLEPRAHARLLSVFHYALKPGGVLLLGTSESVASVPGLFSPIDKKRRIFTRDAGPARSLHLDMGPVHSTRATVGRYTPSVSVLGDTALLPDALRRPGVPDIQVIQRAADQVALESYAPAGVVVDDLLQIIQFRGQTGAYIDPVAGTASFHLLRMVKPDLAEPLRGAILTARSEGRTVRIESVAMEDVSGTTQVILDVTPFRVAGSEAQYFVISFEKTPTLPAAGAGRKARRKPAKVAREKPADDSRVTGELRQQLEAARRHLQTVTEEQSSVLEEFQAAHEEVQSSNEELQSTNEEIETAKEELQSLNEELTVVNDELRVRNTEMHRLNDDLNNLLASMHVPVIMVGTDLRIRRFTTGAERMVSVIATDIGRPIGDIRSNIDVPDLESLITRVMDSLTPAEREVRDNTGHWYLMQIRPYLSSDRKIDGAVIVYYDIDASKRVTQRLNEARKFADAARQTAETANAGKGEFLAAMSHELRTPLNAIAGYVDLIDMGIRGPVTPEQHTDLTRIKVSQAHLLGLINNVLEFAQIGDKRMAYTFTEVAVADMIRAVEVMTAPQMAAKQLTYHCAPCDQALSVTADEVKLRQIMLNLLGNATKFTTTGGDIGVRAERRGERVAIVVSDTGPGIASAKLDAIFEPFVQVNRGYSTPKHGVGLGLAISRELARGMGGDVTVESTPGAGSTFTLTLPRSPSP